MQNKKIRVQKYLSQCGIASRRSSEKMMEDGLVCVNGLLAKIGDSIDPQKDTVTVKGRNVAPKDAPVYIALNKPETYICSCSCKQGASVLDLVKIKERVFPVGRLDKDSNGLVLLTNDGELTNKLTHPRYECEKEYVVTLHSEITEADLKKIRGGIMLDDGMTKPCEAKKVKDNEVRMIIGEGKNRQIRRMFQKLGKKVVKLKRIRIKNLELGVLKPKEWRYLTEEEIAELKS